MLAFFYTYAHNFVLYAFVFVKINFVQEINAFLLLYYPAEWKISFLPHNSQLETITT